MNELPDSPAKRLIAEAAELLHGDRRMEAGRLVANWFREVSGSEFKVSTTEEVNALLVTLLQWTLTNNGYVDAANLLWGPSLFTPKPESCQRIWAAFDESNYIMLMGSASMSKSYSCGVRLMLAWLEDPEFTSVKVLGPSENHLEDNLFTHLVTLHRSSSIPLPGHIGKLFIGLDSKARKGSIQGVIIPLGKKAAGRLQGVKRQNRKQPHPKFGKLSRLFVFIDEAANIPIGVWKDVENLVASSQGDGGLKIIGAFNPANVHDEVGLRVEPIKGWSNFDIDNDVDWVSTRDWRVVRLDAARCENVVSGEVIYPGLQTKEGYEALIRAAGGLDSPGFFTMGRGCFPPAGAPMSIFPAGLLSDIRAEPIWYDRPTPIGAADLAFLGGDIAVFAKGSFGMATGFRFPPSVEHPVGRVELFKDTKGRTRPRNVLFLEALFKLAKGDTVAVKNEIKRLAQSFSIRPDWLCVDRTGNGQGVFDLLRFEYGEVIGVNFSEGSGTGKIMQEDHAPAIELYERVQTELWFALRKWVEFGYCKISSGVDTSELFPQLTQRRFKMMGRKAKVEKKDEYQSRSNGKSPDEADAFTLLVHCARKASGFIPGMAPENSSDHRVGFEDEDEDDRPYVDVTNRHESLD